MLCVDLALLMGAPKGRKFYELIEHYLDNFNNLREKRNAILLNLPRPMRHFAASWSIRWYARASDRDLWNMECADALSLITEDAKAFLTNKGIPGPYDDDVLFDLFVLVVIQFAGSAGENTMIAGYIPSRKRRRFYWYSGGIAVAIALLAVLFYG